MKKTIAILLVAVLAASSVFAGFSGKATVGLGYNWETKGYGFSNGTGFDVNVDLATEEAGNVAEGDIYAGIKATMGVKVANKEGSKGLALWDSADKGTYGAGLFLKVAEAYVASENWKVSITGTQGATSYVKSFETTKDDVKDVFGNAYDKKDVPVDKTASLFSFNKAPGVTVEVAGFKASVGFNGSEDEARKVKIAEPAKEKVVESYVVITKNPLEIEVGDKFDVKTKTTLKDTGKTEKVEVVYGKFFNYNALVETPSFDFNGLTLQAAVGASRKVDNYNAKTHDGEWGWKVADEDTKEMEKTTPKFYQLAINTSAKAGYATEALSVAVAADFDMIQYGEKETPKVSDNLYSFFDASAKVSYAPVTVDAYYAFDGYKAKGLEDKEAKFKLAAHSLSAQVATDLAAFELPVKLTVWGKDILNTMDFGAKAEVTIDAIKLAVNGGYVIDPELVKRKYDATFGKYYLGADVEYTNDLFTAKAGVGFNSYVGKEVKDVAQLTLKASIESEAIIPGATLKLAYGAADGDQNLLKDQIKVAQNFGKVDATCTIKF